MNISILGLGYVGGAMRALLNARHRVSSYDTDPSKEPSLFLLARGDCLGRRFLALPSHRLLRRDQGLRHLRLGRKHRKNLPREAQCVLDRQIHGAARLLRLAAGTLPESQGLLFPRVPAGIPGHRRRVRPFAHHHRLSKRKRSGGENAWGRHAGMPERRRPLPRFVFARGGGRETIQQCLSRDAHRLLQRGSTSTRWKTA